LPVPKWERSAWIEHFFEESKERPLQMPWRADPIRRILRSQNGPPRSGPPVPANPPIRPEFNTRNVKCEFKPCVARNTSKKRAPLRRPEIASSPVSVILNYPRGGKNFQSRSRRERQGPEMTPSRRSRPAGEAPGKRRARKRVQGPCPSRVWA